MAGVFENKYVQLFMLVFIAFFFLLLIRDFFMKNTLWMDEALYSLHAENLYKNGRLYLYDDPSMPLVSSPLQMYVISTLFFLFGESEFMLYLSTALFGIFSLFMVYLLGKKVFSPYVGVAAAILVMFNGIFLFYSVRVLADMPLAFFTVLTVYLFWLVFEEKKYHLAPFLAVALVAGFLMKFTFLSIAVPLLIIALVYYRSEFIKNISSLGLGAFLFLLLVSSVLFYNYYSKGSPTALFLGEYYQGNTAFIEQHGRDLCGYAELLPFMLSNAQPATGCNPIPLASNGIILLSAFGTFLWFWRRSKQILLLASVFIISFAVMSYFTAYKEDRYILFLTPLILLLAAFTLIEFPKLAYKRLSAFLKTYKEKTEEHLEGDVFALVVLVLVSVFAAHAFVSHTLLNYSSDVALVNYRIPSYQGLKPTGAYLQTITNESEVILSPSVHELGFYAKRRIYFVDPNVTNFERDLWRYNARVVAATAYEPYYANLTQNAIEKSKTNSTEISNSFDYMLLSGKFGIANVIYEEEGGQRMWTAIVFVKK